LLQPENKRPDAKSGPGKVKAFESRGKDMRMREGGVGRSRHVAKKKP